MCGHLRHPNLFAQARIKIKSIRKRYLDVRVGYNVWLDAKKTKSELKRNIKTHRVHEVLEQFEAAREDTQPVTKDLSKKCVKIGNKVMGFSHGSEWKWTDEPAKRFSASQLEMAKAYAEQA